MTIRLGLALVTTALVAAGLPPGSAQGLPRFSGYVSCGLPTRPGTHLCDDTSIPYVSFTDRVGSFTLVSQCESHPRRPSVCSSFRTGRAGTPHRRPTALRALGWSRYRWYVAGRLVRTWAIRDVPEPA